MTSAEPIHVVIDRWTRRLAVEIPCAVAVVLKGSHVTGSAGPHSDIDFDVLVSGPARAEYPVRFEPTPSGALRHISIAVQDLCGWMADEAEPEPWAFGMPVREPTRLLWAADATLRERLDRPWKPHPAAEPELEDFIESFAKVRNAFLRGDELGLRQAAQGTARYAPTLLRPLNPEAWADSPRSALAIVLAFDTAPSGYRRDMRMCLGMSDRAVATDGLVAASWRVTSGVLALARTHIEVIAPLLADDLAACLRDGSLSRYVRQLANDP